ncbi:Ribosome maturation factor RimP, C-terminal [Acididesulfobacillus acetoxydans]|uniref:Ribosome maturation factor RimP n=1 Tax=Acididesulfobacillus acetoxydans TaxID=1561005 RepID=A0A8S0WHA6_9FIRM|nr:ribosome maturation factor RimP [Acididesulfobacillus acetoxydans]CAA7602542.1 Ribosome maturation factor RimP, C-terminal [Acididesulfobacillus acetoxydans]CEJ07312.1 Ribosome maturation factor RimP [Acididesulfobacillus acetoxydans]
MQQNVVEAVTSLVEPVVHARGLELVDVEYIKEGIHWFLRLYIDKEGGADLDDCSEISRAVGDILDEADLIPQAYMLEVSSPGLERPLKKKDDYLRYRGQLVQVFTRENVHGYGEFSGYLEGMEGEEVILEYQGEQIRLPYDLIARAHLLVDF